MEHNIAANNFYSKKYFILFSIILSIFNIFDAMSTYYFVGSGIGTELNPIMKYVIENMGWTWFFILKSLLISFCILVLYICSFIDGRIENIRFAVLGVLGSCHLYLMLMFFHMHNIVKYLSYVHDMENNFILTLLLTF